MLYSTYIISMIGTYAALCCSICEPFCSVIVNVSCCKTYTTTPVLEEQEQEMLTPQSCYLPSSFFLGAFSFQHSQEQLVCLTVTLGGCIP